MAAKKKVDSGKHVESKKAVQHISVSPMTSNDQSQQPVDGAPVQPIPIKIQTNAVSLSHVVAERRDLASKGLEVCAGRVPLQPSPWSIGRKMGEGDL